MAGPSESLSQREQTLVARMRRQVKQWPRMRWVFLVLALSSLAVGVYVELTAVQTLGSVTASFSEAREFQGSSVLIACLATKNATLGELLRWAGIYGLISVLAYWKGNPRTTLMLKVVQHLEANGEQGGRGGPA